MVVTRRPRVARFVRTLHRIVGLSITVSVILYAASGLIIVLRDSMPAGGHTEASSVTLSAEAIERVQFALAAPTGSGQQEKLARAGEAVIRELAIPERFKSARKDGDGRFEARAIRPGHVVHVHLGASESQALVTHKTTGPAHALQSFHTLHGYHGGGLYALWAFLLDVVSVATIIFALSGIVIWYLQRRDRLGWVLLLLSSVYTSLSIALLWLRI